METKRGFSEALERHLEAIRERDLERFAATVDVERMVLVTADGEVIADGHRFVELHREWFASPEWTIETDLLHARETGGVATCLLKLDYYQHTEAGELHEESILGLVFAELAGRWLLVQDQNTPLRR